MFKQLEKLLPRPLKVLALRFDRSPFLTVGDLQEFTRTRASYVAQTSLYGYLKTRMGTRYRSLFEDDVFSHSVRIAAARVFGTCLTDLSIHSAALCRSGGGLIEREASLLASDLVTNGLEKGLEDFPDQDVRSEAIGRLRQRLAVLNWNDAGDIGITFSSSEADLVRFAPVVEEFKELDREIVSNSIRFRWRDVREQLGKRLAPQSVANDFRRINGIGDSASRTRA
ncbi:MAG: hypothetical protein OXC26_23135 [Albidovulum sp.]|nr:hypothetical protein [Albidovulum sp.]